MALPGICNTTVDSYESCATLCEPCESLDKSSLLPMKVLARIMSSELPLWHSKEGSAMTRFFTARNLQSALDALNAFGAIAEREGHHPDMHLTSSDEVVIVLSTHKVKGITGNDIALAKMFDSEVKINYSPMWLREHPQAEGTQQENTSSDDAEEVEVHAAGSNVPIGSRTDKVANLITQELPLWVTRQGTAVSKSFVAKDFQSAVDFINDVGAIAKRENHCPDFHLTSYREVVIVVSTRDMECLTESDMRVAKLVDSQVKVMYSPKWLSEYPLAKRTAKNK